MYDNEYDIDNYDNLNQNNLKKFLKSFKINKKIVVLIIIILAILIGLSIYRDNVVYLDSYEYLEETLENSAYKYVNANNLKSSKEFYIEASKLNVPLKNGCHSMSGVLVNGNDYQAYLLCDDYETKIIDNTNNYIKLNGKDILFLNKGNDYVEALYEENEKNVKVNINGNVGREEGVYDLEYVVLQYNVIVAKLKRKVIVIDNNLINSFYPEVSLLGEKIEYLKLLSSYSDKGVVGKDIRDGIIKDVKVTGTVNTSKDGEYNLTYTIVNSLGYADSVKRKVVVLRPSVNIVASSLLSPQGLTNDNVKIMISVYGNNYLHTELPNGEISNKSIIEYSVSENGSYKFLIYDNENKYITETVSVTNINKTAPRGSCSANVYPNYVDVSVNASSNIGISSYKYIVNNKEGAYTSSFNYRINGSNIKTISVKVKDIIGNVGQIDCNVKFMDPTIGNNNVIYYVYDNENYVLPKTKNDLDSFAKRVKGKISQNADPDNCGSACLSFSLYHAYYIQYGDMDKMNLYDACNYHYPIRFDEINNQDKQFILGIIFDEINAGRVIVLQVDQNKQSRHFALVVGYKRNVYSRNELREEDLLFIDSWDGALKTTKISSRRMFSGKLGYRVDKIKSQYYNS